MARKGYLPPLPPSDVESMARNAFDGNYRTRAASFWGENEVIRIEDTPMEKCDHEFIYSENGVQCKKCHFGLMGVNLEIRDKKLFSQGEPLGL